MLGRLEIENRLESHDHPPSTGFVKEPGVFDWPVRLHDIEPQIQAHSHLPAFLDIWNTVTFLHQTKDFVRKLVY
jgi:hypothetical protein